MSTVPDSFDPGLFNLLYEREDRHFWFQTRRSVIKALASQVVRDRPSGYRVLEIGCGTGNVLEALESACPGGQVVGLDPFPAALELARRRTKRSELIAGDVFSTPFDHPFALIGLFNVIEHLPDDLAMLRRARELVSDDGALLVTVPAHQYLWSYFDLVSHHERRYECQSLEERIHQAGFRVEFVSEFFSVLLPPMWLSRKIKRKSSTLLSPGETHQLAEKELRIVPGMNGLAKLLLSFEVGLLARRIRLPFGTSIVGLASAA